MKKILIYATILLYLLVIYLAIVIDIPNLRLSLLATVLAHALIFATYLIFYHKF